MPRQPHIPQLGDEGGQHLGPRSGWPRAACQGKQRVAAAPGWPAKTSYDKGLFGMENVLLFKQTFLYFFPEKKRYH